MFATLIAVIIALVLGHVAPAAIVRIRRYEWFDQWLLWLRGTVGDSAAWQGKYAITLALAPLLLIALLQWLLDLSWLQFLLGVAVLVYAWGPRDLDVDVQAVLDSVDASARRDALSNLRAEGDVAQASSSFLVDAVFLGALRRWFGVLFWFVLLGPFGALLFRLVNLASGTFAERLSLEGVAGARWVKSVLEWPVAQLMSLSLALVGNFDAVWTAWRAARGGELQLDPGFVVAAGRACVKSELAEEAEDYEAEGMIPRLSNLPELRDAMSLVWRILLLWLVVFALFVIGGWIS